MRRRRRRRASELNAAFTLTTGITQVAAQFSAVRLLSQVGGWLEDGEKEQPKDSKTPSPTKSVFADAFLNLQSLNLAAIARNAATKPGEDAQVAVALVWKHSPWYLAKTAIKAVHVVKGKAGILGSKVSSSLESGMKYTKEVEKPESQKGAKLPKKLQLQQLRLRVSRHRAHPTP